MEQHSDNSPGAVQEKAGGAGSSPGRNGNSHPMGRVGKLAVMFWTMARIGCLTFGGGWSIIGQMQAEFVEKRGWLTEEQIIDFMSLARSFPGIMIINMSVLCGYAMEGAAGALSAALGLSAPAVIANGLVTYFYSSLKSNPYVEKVLNGVRCVVIPIILQAAWKLKNKSLISTMSWLLFAAAFCVCAFTGVSKPAVIVAGAAAGLVIWGKGGNHDTV